MFSNSPKGHNEVDADFAVYARKVKVLISQMHQEHGLSSARKKPDWTIRKFKARYCVRGDIQKRLSPKPLNSYSPVVQWATVRLMLILQCILGLQSQSIDFTNSFAQADIPSGEPFFIELPRYFKSDGGQYDVFSPK